MHRLARAVHYDAVPTTKGPFGEWADHMADKAFVLPPLAALTIRREVSPLHLGLKIRRDRRVNGFKRKMIELNGGSHKSQAARRKTFVDMSAVTLPSGPLAANRSPLGVTWTELAFTAGTFLSEYSAKEYGDALQKAIADVNVNDIEELLHDIPVLRNGTEVPNHELVQRLQQGVDDE